MSSKIESFPDRQQGIEENATAYLQQAQTYCNQRKWKEAIAACEQALVNCWYQVLSQDPEQVTPEKHVNLGDKLLEQGQVSEAIACYRQAAELQPNFWKAHHQLGEALHKQQRWEEAATAYRRTLELKPDFSLSRRYLAHALLKQKKWDEAIALSRATIARDCNLPWAYIHLGTALVETGQEKEAYACYQKASQLRGWSLCAERDYQFTRDWFTNKIPVWKHYLQHFSQVPGVNVLEIGSFEGMSTCWLLDNLLTHPSARITCIDINFPEKFGFNISQTGAAEKVTQLVGNSHHILPFLDPNAYDLIYIDGCHQASHVQQDAVLSWNLLKVGGLMIFDDYLWSHPRHPGQEPKIGIDAFLDSVKSEVEILHQAYQVIVKKKEGLSQQGHKQQAIAIYCQSAAQNPEDAESHYRLGQALAAQKKWSEALLCYRRAIKLNPDIDQFYSSLGEALIQQDQLAQAVTCLRKAIELNPALAQTHLQLGNILRKQGHLHEAVSCYLKTIQIQPDLPEPYIHLRCNLLRYEIPNNSVLLDQVSACFRQVIHNQPDQILAHSCLGYVLTKQGKLDEAIATYRTASYKQALRLRPSIGKLEWDWATRKAPDFLIIGAEKCGTTSLYHYLNQHPQFLPSIEKELDFFDREFDRGIDWYLAHFPPIPEGRFFLTGEASANYIYSPHAPQRAFQLFPQLKLIVILRNPVDRTVSRYYMMFKKGRRKGAFEEVITSEMRKIQNSIQEKEIPWNSLNQCRNVGNSLYIYHLKRWMNLFPREQFLILKSEDLYTHPAALLKQIFEFLNVPEHQLSDYKKYNAGSYSSISDAMRRTLAEFFRPHNQKLEDYLGMKFNWE